jgi:hypothetical protein
MEKDKFPASSSVSGVSRSSSGVSGGGDELEPLLQADSEAVKKTNKKQNRSRKALVVIDNPSS